MNRIHIIFISLRFLHLLLAFTAPIEGTILTSCKLNNDKNSSTTTADTFTSNLKQRNLTVTNLSKSGHDNEAWKRGFTTCPKEIQPVVLAFPDLPSDFPIGTYYHNILGRYEADDGVQVWHPFDADGLVAATTFDAAGKRVLFRNRFVRTEGYVKDKATKTMSQPGVFGTKVSGGRLKNLFRTDFKNAANIHVLYANATLYTLWEGGWPYRLDPLTLENDVKAEPTGHNLNGLLKAKDPLAAHYKYDPTTNTFVDFASLMDFKTGKVTIKLYEFDADTMEPKTWEEVSATFPGIGLFHDYGVTRNWCIFSIPPAKIDYVAVIRALLGKGAFTDAIDFQNDAKESRLFLIPRIGNLKGDTKNMKIGVDDRIKVVKVPFHFGFHISNAYENSDGHVVFDIMQMKQAFVGVKKGSKRPYREGLSWEKDVFATSYVRYIIDPNGKGSLVKPPQVIVENRANEFPRVPTQLSTKLFRYSYTTASHREFQPNPTTGAGSGPSGAIAKVDTVDPTKTEFYSFLPYEFVGEPIFVAKTGVDVTIPEQEDKGYVLVEVIDGKNLTTDLVILDAEGLGALQKGPIARLRLPTFIPDGLHGIFVDDLTFTF